MSKKASGRPNIAGRRIRVRGLVQGVGFRPTVWRIASEENIAGQVLNDGEGVLLEAWGPHDALERLVQRIHLEAPPLSRIDSVSQEPLADGQVPVDFGIVESDDGAVSTGIVPDAATCPACLAEIRNAGDRRFGYPFTNCTHCGPRLSIVRSIPYDRATTSMAEFRMCPQCSAEYSDPADRRFHAQPNACPQCGPGIWLEAADGAKTSEAVVVKAAELLVQGKVIAIKGLGGFHLACNAIDNDAVLELRQRKRRYAKPFAVMAADIDEVARHCELGDEEARLLQLSSAPIVLLSRKGGLLADAIAPGHDRLGFMLPYTPLHHLLLDAAGGPMVMTSGNRSDEPQVTGNGEARDRLAGIADYWLMNDRDIVNRLDDSVMRFDAPGPQIIRRARGIAPAPLAAPPGFEDTPPVLAVGGELKSAFCLFDGGMATVSQHLGDLQNAATYSDYRKAMELYRRMFRFEPEIIAVDRHAAYFSSQWGRALARDSGAMVVEVQHHHAHLAACLADNGVVPGEALSVGVILDGLGLGADGTVWGGEILVGDYAGFVRTTCFQPVALPGGDQAIREPWRNLAAQLRAAFGAEWQDRGARQAALAEKPLALIEQMIARGVNAPLSSSAGRLFDAAAAAIGICADRQHYEGHAAMEMEALARPFMTGAAAYPTEWVDRRGVTYLDSKPMWIELLDDIDRGVAPGEVAARFHATIVDTVANAAHKAAALHGIERVVLSGGVFQNQIIAEALHGALSRAGLKPLTHRQVPANDGGLCLGQAVIAAAGHFTDRVI